MLPAACAALYQQRAGKGESLDGLTAMQLRDMLLALAPLDKDWVVQVGGWAGLGWAGLGWAGLGLGLG